MAGAYVGHAVAATHLTVLAFATLEDRTASVGDLPAVLAEPRTGNCGAHVLSTFVWTCATADQPVGALLAIEGEVVTARGLLAALCAELLAGLGRTLALAGGAGVACFYAVATIEQTAATVIARTAFELRFETGTLGASATIVGVRVHANRARVVWVARLAGLVAEQDVAPAYDEHQGQQVTTRQHSYKNSGVAWKRELGKCEGTRVLLRASGRLDYASAQNTQARASMRTREP